MKSKIVSIFLCIVMVASISVTITQNLGQFSMNASGAGSLNVEVTSHFSTLNSAAQSLITVHVTNGTNPVQDAIVNLRTDNGGMFSPQSGTTDINGNFTSIFNAPTMTTQIICRITTQANKTGYNNGSGYVDITIKPIPWPMFRHNLNHTGLSPYDTSANPGKLKWSFTTGFVILASPAIGSDGTIYVGSNNKNLNAINPDGTEKWNFTTGDKVSYSTAVIDFDGTIYIGSTDYKLYAINPDGTQKWSFMTGDQVESSPAIGSDGTIYIGSWNNKLLAINPDGTEKWSFTTNDNVRSSPAIGPDGTIYVGSDDFNLYAINPNGTQKWSFMTGDQVSSSPAIGSDGTIYVGSNDDNFYAINPNGTEKWIFITGSDIVSSPATGSDGTIYVGSGDNKLYAINPDGTEKWTFMTGGEVNSSPAIGSDGTIYVGSRDNNLYAIYPNGSKKWSFTAGDWILPSPAIGSDGTIYVGSHDGKLYAIGNPSLEVEITSHFSTFNSAAQSAITVHVTNGTNPVQGASVNLETDNGGMFNPQSGITDVNGNFTSIFNAPTVTTQIICRITAQANKTGYNNGSGYVDITINPIPWPMFSHNCRRTSLSPYDTSSNPGKLKWSFTTGALVYSPPSIGSDGTIYVGSYDNKLYAINPDGTEKWNFMTGDSIGSSPAIGSDGTIYVGSYDNKLYAIHPNGTEKWNFKTSHDVRSSPAIASDGTIYIASQDKKLYAINPDGTEKWNFTTGESVHSSPAIASDGTIYIGSLDSKLYAINPDGTEKWNFTTGDRVWSSPAIGTNETIYVGSDDNKLYAIDQYGTEIWSFITNGDVFSSPAISPDGIIYIGSYDHNLYSINPDGTENWNFTTGSWVLSSSAIGSDKTIYVGSGDNNLYAINPDGTEKWRYTTEDGIISSPGISSDGTIYVGSYDGKLYAIGKAVTPPRLYINVSQDGEDLILYWDAPSTLGIDHYLLYRSTSQIGFDFNTIWVNTSKDNESGEPGPIPLRIMWNDTKAALPGDPNYEKEYYYIIRAVNVVGEVSRTSRTVGKWTKTFPQGISTFSLPLEPLGTRTTDYYLTNMNATYIKWMNQTTHTWMKHGEGGVNDTQMKMGEGYEVKFDNQTNYTFTGMPGAMISYDDDTGFLGFDSATEAKNLTVSVEPNENVTLTWEGPASMNPGDWYEIYYSNTRDGFFNTFNVSYFLVCPPVYFGNNTTTHNGVLANNSGTRLYYMVVPFNASGVRGTSTYSIGIWTEEYLSQYDTIGIPLKLSMYHTADWYCDNIPDTVGINYYDIASQRWCWHSTRMPAGAFDPGLEMAEGYQISTSNVTKFTFIGI
jgi:outer membrane protein assembly factor BamB